MWRGFQYVINYCVSLAKIFCVFSVAFFLPKLFIYYAHQQVVAAQHAEYDAFKLGVENLTTASLKNFLKSDGKHAHIGLITNQTGKDQQGNRNIDLLLEKGVSVGSIFTPKHGFNANQQLHSTHINEDEVTKIPMLSWQDYKLVDSPCYAHLQKADVLVFDIQDSGMRYGYITTLLEVMEAAAQHKKKVVVLDRPNILGHSMEGVVAHDPKQANLPTRHGMTTGELAHYFNKYALAAPIDLHVVPMENYQRCAVKNKPKLYGNLSPNLTSLDSCYGYSFLGLLGEVGPFDVGLGTDKAFQCLALPDRLNFSKQKWYELRTLLKDFGVESRVYRYYSARKKDHYTGLSLSVTNVNDFSSFAVLLSVVKFFKNEGVALKLSREFDQVVGTQNVRKVFEGAAQHADLKVEINEGLRNFYHKAASSFMYTPLPKVINL